MTHARDSRPLISVVIPCLNEEQSLAAVIDAARAGFARLSQPGEVVVVDNGSTDRSAEIARAHGARVISEARKGYGSALRRGFAESRGAILVMGDADQTYDFSRMDDLVRPVLDGQADMVVGNRMRNIRPGSMPRLHRYVGNPALSLILRIMFHNNSIKDPQCGMRAISKAAYGQLRCVTTGMEFASEMIIRAIHCRLRITERDIVYHARAGESKLRSFQDGWRHLRFMMLHSPTMILLVPGLVVWAVGLALSSLLAFGPVMIGARRVDIHCMIVGGLLNIVSVQVIAVGMLAKAYAHLSGLRNDPVVAWFYRWFTFERTFLLSIPLIGVGLLVFAKVIVEWTLTGFGPLNEARALFFGLLCLVNGVQVGSASYLFSIMALPRHLDTTPAQAEDTAVADA